ncbi:MAG: hypothetical protein B6241_11570 [Spirochaetaceae bacterium 4572_59]|nr:MAG: hypothetical protein B6241_11570 [Spirochaetaceae bacterium 4572_59]
MRWYKRGFPVLGNLLTVVLFCIFNMGLTLFFKNIEFPRAFSSLSAVLCGTLLGPVPGIIAGLIINTFGILLFGYSVLTWADFLISCSLGLVCGLFLNRKSYISIFSFFCILFVFTILPTLIVAVSCFGHSHVSLSRQMGYMVVNFQLLGFSEYSSILFSCFIFNLIEKSFSLMLAFFLYAAVKRTQKSNY